MPIYQQLKRQDNSHKVFTLIEMPINYFRVETAERHSKRKNEKIKVKMSVKSNACEHTFNFTNV